MAVPAKKQPAAILRKMEKLTDAEVSQYGLRKHFMDRLHADFDFWYERAKAFALESGREADPSVKLVMKIMDKMGADQKDHAPIEDQSVGGTALSFVIVGVSRGTGEARKLALIEQERMRQEPKAIDVESTRT